MNEATTFAKAGETAGAALGTGVEAVREGASRAGRQLSDQVAEHGSVGRAAQQAGLSAQTALADRWGQLQETWPDRVVEARRELAGRLDPGPPPAPRRSRRRWPLLLLVAVAVGGAVAAVVLARRPQPVEDPDAMPQHGPRPVQPTDPGGAAHGNGALDAENRSAWRD